jgi:hypothetical protein
MFVLKSFQIYSVTLKLNWNCSIKFHLFAFFPFIIQQCFSLSEMLFLMNIFHLIILTDHLPIREYFFDSQVILFILCSLNSFNHKYLILLLAPNCSMIIPQ